MEPDVFIGREQPRKPGTNDTNDIAKHREEDETTVVGENEASTARSPNGELETIQSGEFRVCGLRRRGLMGLDVRESAGVYLTVPAVSKEEEVRSIEKDVK